MQKDFRPRSVICCYRSIMPSTIQSDDLASALFRPGYQAILWNALALRAGTHVKNGSHSLVRVSRATWNAIPLRGFRRSSLRREAERVLAVVVLPPLGKGNNKTSHDGGEGSWNLVSL